MRLVEAGVKQGFQWLPNIYFLYVEELRVERRSDGAVYLQHFRKIIIL